MGIRKNQSTLSQQEKDDFVDAVLQLKQSGKYDDFVQMHVDAMANPTPSTVSPMVRNSAHRGPAFLAWHRKYLRDFELELQKINPSVNLPYWDWTVDNNLNSSIFSDDFMGGNGNPSNGNRVETGPFSYKNWALAIDGPALRRSIGSMASSLPTSNQVQDCLSITTYDSPPWDATSDPVTSFRNRLEGWLGAGNIHNRVHVWIGGSMTLGSSPNDPLFFLHHCFIDKLWAQWQQNFPSSGYLPTDGTNTGHNLNDQMFPWGSGVTPDSVLDISALGYSYDSVPSGTVHNVNLTDSVSVSDDATVTKKTSSTTKPPPATTPSRCFIATAAYGSELEPPVQFLREFRDDVVLQSRFQKPFSILLEGYYKFSPYVADQMRRHKSLKHFMKYSVVWPFVGLTTACAFVLQKLGLK